MRSAKCCATASGRGKCFLDSDLAVIVSCEHAANAVPDAYASLFRGHSRDLRSHRGYDIGAIELAGLFAERFGIVAHSATVTRLLVDLNRSRGNRGLFSLVSSRLTAAQRELVMREYYRPFRREVESEVARLRRGRRRVLHLSVHTFTPVLNGMIRLADVGLLYDPGRRRERLFCRCWKGKLKEVDPSLKVRLNYPYSGKSDGFTTHLRSEFEDEVYLGIEIEVNQKHALGKRRRWLDVQHAIVESLTLTLEEYESTGD